MRLKIRRLEELKVFNSLKLSVVVTAEVLVDILADVLMDITAEAVAGQEDQVEN